MNDVSSANGEPLSPVKRAIVELPNCGPGSMTGAPPFRADRPGRHRLSLPGGADTPESFWALIRDGVDAVTSAGRPLGSGSHHDPRPEVPGQDVDRMGGFLQDVDRFDEEFFGISPREAAGIDPQQRLLLEVSWRRWKTPGRPRPPFGTPAGVFFGIGSIDYARCRPATAPRSCWTPTTPPASPTASPPGGSPMPWASRGRPSRWTRPARRRWWRSISPARACVWASAPRPRRRRQPDLDA